MIGSSRRQWRSTAPSFLERAFKISLPMRLLIDHRLIFTTNRLVHTQVDLLTQQVYLFTQQVDLFTQQINLSSQTISFLVRPAAIQTDQFFVSYDDCGDDRFSPVMGGRVPPPCIVDLDSLLMLPWDGHMNVETGSRTGVWDWRSVLCDVARLSRMPVFPGTDCLNCFRNIGQTCVLDLNVRGTYPCVEPP